MYTVLFLSSLTLKPDLKIDLVKGITTQATVRPASSMAADGRFFHRDVVFRRGEITSSYQLRSFPLEILQNGIFAFFQLQIFHMKVADLSVEGEATKLHAWTVDLHIHGLLEKQPCPIDRLRQVQVFTLEFCLDLAIQRLDLHNRV